MTILLYSKTNKPGSTLTRTSRNQTGVNKLPARMNPFGRENGEAFGYDNNSMRKNLTRTSRKRNYSPQRLRERKGCKLFKTFFSFVVQFR